MLRGVIGLQLRGTNLLRGQAHTLSFVIFCYRQRGVHIFLDFDFEDSCIQRGVLW